MAEPGEAAAVDAALQAAADEIERELICCPDDEWVSHHHICRWGQASRRIVLSYMTPSGAQACVEGPRSDVGIGSAQGDHRADDSGLVPQNGETL